MNFEQLPFHFQIAPFVQLSNEEIEFRMQQEYQKYLEEEASFLRNLGLLKDDSEEILE